MAKKKKNPITFGDKVLMGCSVFGGFLTLCAVLPFAPWRFAKQNAYMGGRFGSFRKYTLFTMGNQFGQQVSLMTYRRNICQKAKMMNTPNPMDMLIAKTMSLGGGGALGGCSAWAACKAHANARCDAYFTMGMLGIIVAILNAVGVVAGFSVPVLISSEPVGKKTKKKEQQKAHRFNTMLCSMAALTLPFIMSTVWVSMSHITYTGLKTTGFYPYPAAYLGMYFTYLGSVITGVGTVLAVKRYKDFQVEGPEEEAEEDIYEGAAGDLPAEADILMPGFLPPAK